MRTDATEREVRTDAAKREVRTEVAGAGSYESHALEQATGTCAQVAPVSNADSAPWGADGKADRHGGQVVVVQGTSGNSLPVASNFWVE